MSKNKHKNKNRNGNLRPASNGAQTSSASPQMQTPTPLQTQVEQLETAAVLAGVAVEIVGEPAKCDIPGAGTTDEAVSLCSRLQLLIEAYTRANKACEEREFRVLEAEDELKHLRAKFDEERRDVDEARQALQTERDSLDNAKSALEADQRDAEARLATTLEREEQLHKREADADAGFITRREEALRELQRAHEDLLERDRQFHERAAEREQAHVERLQQQQAEHEKKLESRRRDFESGLETRELALRTSEEAIRSRERELERALFNAREATRDAGDLKAHIDDYIEDRAAERVANLNRRLEAAFSDAEALRSRIHELERTLAERDAAARVLENMSPEAVKARIETLQRRIRDLEDELADRPSKADADELRALRDERTRLEQDQRRLLAEKGRLENRLDRLMIEVDRVESLRDRNTALLETQRLLKAALDDLRTDIDERLDKHRDQPVFQKFLEMDQAPALNEVPLRLFPGNDEIDLRDFAVDLRHRIGLDPTGERPKLFYRDEDIRAFLGGLAMSRLHLIQGISGIGKSSLPRVFADAVGGFCETVSVPAGWRDRNDLFGYYNAFERRYYELAFAQAVYRAGTPHWRDRIAIVLLDEMNLSHPEHYAADVLDVLERQHDAERKFELVSFTPPGTRPVLLVDGQFLKLPKNVWFIGTANHDETTKDFADKTYDRSFVLELPGRPTPFPLTKQARRAPVSYQALSDAFDRAANAHAEVAQDALGWLQQHLRGPLDQRFRIGWGGRLESQVRRFVPVVLAAGGGPR